MMAHPKAKPIRSKKLRRSASGQDCTLRLPNVCNFDPATTVLAHLPDGNGMMGGKSSDLHAVYSCSSCHDIIDSRAPRPLGLTEMIVVKAERDALAETHRRMTQEGLIRVVGA